MCIIIVRNVKCCLCKCFVFCDNVIHLVVHVCQNDQYTVGGTELFDTLADLVEHFKKKGIEEVSGAWVHLRQVSAITHDPQRRQQTWKYSRHNLRLTGWSQPRTPLVFPKCYVPLPHDCMSSKLLPFLSLSFFLFVCLSINGSLSPILSFPFSLCLYSSYICLCLPFYIYKYISFSLNG